MASPSELIYTDGACTGNGTASATGGFGIYIAKTHLFDAAIMINRKGEQMSYQDATYSVTNIRMEGLAIVSVLALYADALLLRVAGSTDPLTRLAEIDVYRTFGTFLYDPTELKVELESEKLPIDSIEIVTDSQFWIRVIQDWMPVWVRKNIVLEKKNPDILLMIRYYTELLKHNGVRVILTHVHSHQKGARTAHADGNDVADVLACKAVNNLTTAFQMVPRV